MNPHPTFDGLPGDGVLDCPYCGDFYLAPLSAKQTSCGPQDITVAATKNGLNVVNIYAEGLLISFSCEGCDEFPVLSIQRDNGNTQLTWVDKKHLDATWLPQ